MPKKGQLICWITKKFKNGQKKRPTYVSKDNLKELKRYGLGYIFINYVSSKGLIAKIYKELSKLQ